MNQTDIDSLVLSVLAIKPRGEFENWLDLGTPKDVLFALRGAYRFPPFHVADIDSFNVKGDFFDFVTSFCLIDHTHKPYKLAAKIGHALTVNGEALVGFLNPRHYSKWFGYEDKKSTLTKGDLSKLLNNYGMETQFVEKGRWFIAYAHGKPKVKCPTVF